MDNLPGKSVSRVEALGVTIGGEIDLAASEGIGPIDRTIPAGHAGTLTTATVAMVAGHGLADGTFDVHGVGWCRYGCAIDFTADSGAITAGSGDALANGPVVITAAVVLSLPFDGDNAALIGVGSSEQTHMRFIDAGGAVIGQGVYLIPAGGSWTWVKGQGANPLSGNAAVSLVVSNGSSVNAARLQETGLQFQTS